MVNPTPDLNSSATSQMAQAREFHPTPLRCLLGGLISAVFAVGLYFLTTAIHKAFTHTPIPNSSTTAINIATAVRTLVLGLSALGMVTFGIAALGLFGLTIQLLIQGDKAQSAGTPPRS